MYHLKRVSFALMVAGSVSGSYAAPLTQPNASSLSQDYKSLESKATVMPQLDNFTLNGAPLSEDAEGGIKVPLNAIMFSGNRAFDSSELNTVLTVDKLEATYDLAGLKALANRISVFYRESGYPFARAFIPAQDLGDGQLAIEVIEGRYGVVTTTGEADLVKSTQGYLGDLKLESVIYAPELERAVLILSDQPGITIVPVMQPSKKVGSGDLMVSVREGERYFGSLGVDNYGNRYSGSDRFLLDFSANRLLKLGDELSFSAFITDESTWLGQAQYAFPVGYKGLRAEFGYSNLDYNLIEDFGSGFSGTATTQSFQLSYPLVRSMLTNVTALTKFSRSEYLDQRGGFEDSKDAKNLQVGLQFDHRDSFYGGGVTYGNLFNIKANISQSSTVTDSSFNVHKGLIARVQNLPSSYSLFTSVSGQYANQSIDGTQQTGLGGVNGVRAYPQGEASGSKSLTSQIEIRYNKDEYQPFVFYDMARRIKTEDETSRDLSGAGLGLRYTDKMFSAEVLSAWKVKGGDSVSDSKQQDPQIWFKARYNF